MAKSINKTIRSNLKKKLMNRDVFLEKLQDEHNSLFNLMKRTVEFGESNSALVIGSLGSGKTSLVKSVLKELEILPFFHNNAIVVILNGLVHVDDKLALKSITKQMCLENSVGDRVFGSFAENLNFLLTSLKTGKSGQFKSVLFILEEFEFFCSHHNQTLLYNLFDVAQSAQAPICVLGLTCNVSVVELLEKRVKSRFSHRKIWLFLDFTQSASEFLTLPEETDLNKPEIIQWNKHVKKIFTDAKIRSALKMISDISHDCNHFRNLVFQFVCEISDNGTWPDVDTLLTILENNYKNDSTVNLLLGLSILELCLIITMKHQCEIYDWQPFNFEMIFSRYIKFANSVNGLQTDSKHIVMKAFEHLKELCFILPSGSKSHSEYQMYKLKLSPQQISEAIKSYPELPVSIAQWATSSIS